MKFKHSGDLGDIIYSLPTVKALGGGVLYLNPGVRFTNFKRAGFDFIKPLLLSQSYIKGVELYTPNVLIDYDLDRFRSSGFNLSIENLASMYPRVFGVDGGVINKPWLFLNEKKVIDNKGVVIHRSPRYHNNNFDWKKVLKEHEGDIVFVGLKQEHSDFVKEFGEVPFYQVKDSLELAMIINGSKLFVGNQSSPFSISEGLHKTNLLEVCQHCPNCNFKRQGHNEGVVILEFNVKDLFVTRYTENGYVEVPLEQSVCYEFLMNNDASAYESYHELVKKKYNHNDVPVSYTHLTLPTN